MMDFQRNMLFFAQFLRFPLIIGSICPSGKALTRVLVEMAVSGARGNAGIIVDLGAGTGVVSRELLRRGIKPENILAIDVCEDFLDAFHQNCPQLRLNIGDARDLRAIISGCFHMPHVRAIISSLPLKSLPGKVVSSILEEIRQVLNEHKCVFIQYTYAFWKACALTRFGFQVERKQYIAKNLPPALIEKYSL